MHWIMFILLGLSSELEEIHGLQVIGCFFVRAGIQQLWQVGCLVSRFRLKPFLFRGKGGILLKYSWVECQNSRAYSRYILGKSHWVPYKYLPVWWTLIKILILFRQNWRFSEDLHFMLFGRKKWFSMRFISLNLLPEVLAHGGFGP